MKNKELQTWRSKTLVEMQKELGDTYANFNKLKLDISIGKSKNVRELRRVRKTIAQLNTIAKSRSSKVKI
ncbi:MAG: 50S ribosomal protein L29 [Patescibacteria group bacterium]